MISFEEWERFSIAALSNADYARDAFLAYPEYATRDVAEFDRWLSRLKSSDECATRCRDRIRNMVDSRYQSDEDLLEALAEILHDIEGFLSDIE